MREFKNLLVLTICAFLGYSSAVFAEDTSKIANNTEKQNITNNSSFLDLAKARYSVRSYAKKEVEKEKLDLILEAGRVAPTARNSQPQHIYVVKSEAGINKLKKVLRTTFDAPILLVFCYDDKIVYKKPEENNYSTGEMDTSIVCTHMMLEAAEQGLGTCWLRGFIATDVEKALELPENMKVVCILTLGYPSEDSKPSPMHESRKPIAETVSEL